MKGKRNNYGTNERKEEIKLHVRITLNEIKRERMREKNGKGTKLKLLIERYRGKGIKERDTQRMIQESLRENENGKERENERGKLESKREK